MDDTVSMLLKLQSGDLCTSGLIVGILGREFPLTLRELCLRVTRERGMPISYQAVHRAIRRLLDKRVIERGGKKYQLSRRWIASVGEYHLRVKKDYDTALRMAEFSDALRDGKGGSYWVKEFPDLEL